MSAEPEPEPEPEPEVHENYAGKAITRDDEYMTWQEIEEKFCCRLPDPVRKLKEKPYYRQRGAKWHHVRVFGEDDEDGNAGEGLLTSSDFAGMIGVCKYATPRKVLQKKLARKYGLEQVPFRTSAAMLHGIAYEDVALASYERVTGKKVLTFGLLISEEERWLGGSPDGITTDGIVLEVKCPSSREITADDHIPENYIPQIMGNMWVTGLHVAHYVEFRPKTSYYFGEELKIVELHFSDMYWRVVLSHLKAFWQWFTSITCAEEAQMFMPGGRKRSVLDLSDGGDDADDDREVRETSRCRLG